MINSAAVARPPECRVSKFTNAGSLKMGFTSTVKVPDGTSDKIKEQNLRNRRLLADGLPTEPNMIEVFAVKEELEDLDDDQVREPLMDGWELLEMGEGGFEIKLNFTSPVSISSGDEADLLLI